MSGQELEYVLVDHVASGVVETVAFYFSSAKAISGRFMLPPGM